MLPMHSRLRFKSVDLNFSSYYHALHNKKLIVTLSSPAGVLGSMQQGGVFHILSLRDRAALAVFQPTKPRTFDDTRPPQGLSYLKQKSSGNHWRYQRRFQCC
jgi:hypothetical protein